MLSRRIATFLIGAWVGCGILMGVLLLQNARWAKVLTGDPTDAAKVLLIKLGEEDAQLLLEYGTAEHTRTFLSGWETAQLVLGAVLLGTLFFSAQRRILPLLLTAGMLTISAVQHFAVSPEVTSLGRQADFLPDESAYSARTRLASLNQIYIGSEALKLLIGGVLASYLFVANSGKKIKRRKRAMVDSPEPM